MKHSSKPLRIRCLVLAAALPALPVFAHPGHSPTDASATHLLTSPYHVVTLALAGIAFYASAKFVQGRMPRRALQVAGTALLFCAVILWGLRV